ncbi:cyclase family protein [Nesterenkonia xinjiangensis]|uniref:Kynurenine formamidase n=1 Tax=Nesterenkonia xinjiangensis TaxID=225327 RepID=A0A7Z0K9H4_9MICC|nr:cyclase family protein [Nesterenkonia xinjiangensis]NYJ78739.1 kynurenine formamidase [Nesterenkonia xinjiangensis]
MTSPEASVPHDLSRPIHDAMMVYPGDPAVVLGPGLTLEGDGVAVARLTCGSHTGTHLDAPSHTVPGGRTTSQIRLEELIGPARVIHLEAGPGHLVAPQDLSLGDAERLPRRVFLAFGWDRFFGTEQALQHPGLSVEAAELLWSRGMRVLGTDALSPDLTGAALTDPASTDPEAGFPVHELVLGRDGLIVENLTGLRDLPAGEHHVGIFPLPLADVDGAPARVVAWRGAAQGLSAGDPPAPPAT